MYCPDCGHNNPDGNRFCGMCGESLPDRGNKKASGTRPVVTPAEFAPPARETHTVRDTRREDFVRDEPVIHREKWVEAPPSPANPVYSERERAAVREPERREERRGTYHDSGSSFLGLGSQVDEPPEREISWRFWALMLVLLGIIALFGVEWRANRMRAAEQPKPAATQPEEPAATSGPTDDNPQQKSDTAQPSPDQNNKDQNAQPAAGTDTSGKDAAPKKDVGKGADAKSKTEGKGAKAADPNAPDSQDDSTTTDEPKNDAPQAKQTRAPQARESATAFSDEPVQQADARIAAGDCNGAVNLLRNAGTNPRAYTKLGAMYLTGTCVQQDRVSAYAYFSQAFQADPHNLRLENTRRMIWSQMTDDERAKIEHGFQAQ